MNSSPILLVKQILMCFFYFMNEQLYSLFSYLHIIYHFVLTLLYDRKSPSLSKLSECCFPKIGTYSKYNLKITTEEPENIIAI